MFYQVFARRKRSFIIVILLTLLLNLFVYYNMYQILYIKFYYYYNPTKSITCYYIKDETLDDITTVKPQPKLDESIFFHETSCNSFFNRNRIRLTKRQACAIESAARLNPNYQVFLLVTSPGRVSDDLEDDENNRILHALKSYDNVNIYHLDFETYTKGTPVERLFKDGILQRSNYAQSHASDILRYLTLWKYGGIYLDLDVIVIKSLEEIKERNYAGAESAVNVAAGILRFSSDGVGHQLAEQCLNDLRENFSGVEWGRNGPGVITKLLREKCGVQKAKYMTNNPNCSSNFSVFPPETFYTVPWWNWTMFFDENAVNQMDQMLSKSYIMHVWNKHSSGTKIDIHSNVPYIAYAKRYCPRVLEQCSTYF